MEQLEVTKSQNVRQCSTLSGSRYNLYWKKST